MKWRLCARRWSAGKCWLEYKYSRLLDRHHHSLANHHLPPVINMPAIQPNSHVLVTGGSGFIAIWTVYQLLERGHKVRATVRSDDKGQYLQDVFKKYRDKLSYVIAEDLEKEGAFDEAVQGVDAVLHTASPFHFNIEGDPKRTLINPAVNGTRNVLSSIHKHGKDVKRVVITSSFAAILDSTRQGHIVYTEKDWNISSVENVEKKGKDQEGPDAYRASKTMAERAAWEFVETHKPSWDLVTVNPPLVFGPIIHQVNSAEKLNTSVGFVWACSTDRRRRRICWHPQATSSTCAMSPMPTPKRLFAPMRGATGSQLPRPVRLPGRRRRYSQRQRRAAGVEETGTRG